MNATGARFQRQVRAVIKERFGRDTPYAYYNRPRGSPSPRVAESTIKQWLRDEKACMPTTDLLVAFAEEMGTTLDYLVLDRGPMTPGLSRPEADLAADLRTYLVESLGRRAAVRPYELQKHVRFFERFLPRGQVLLDAVETVVLEEVKANHRDRWERTRMEVLQVLLDKRKQTRDRKARARIDAQIVAGVQSAGDVPLLLDEEKEPESSPGALLASPWEGHDAKGEESVPPAIRRSLRARAAKQKAREPARRATRMTEAERDLERRLQERVLAGKRGDRATNAWANERVERARERLKRLRGG